MGVGRTDDRADARTRGDFDSGYAPRGLSRKADLVFGSPLWRPQQFVDLFPETRDVPSVSRLNLLHVSELSHDVLVCRKYFAYANERAHDQDIHLDRPVALEYARQHGDALLRENIRCIAAAAASV